MLWNFTKIVPRKQLITIKAYPRSRIDEPPIALPAPRRRVLRAPVAAPRRNAWRRSQARAHRQPRVQVYVDADNGEVLRQSDTKLSARGHEAVLAGTRSNSGNGNPPNGAELSCPRAATARSRLRDVVRVRPRGPLPPAAAAFVPLLCVLCV